MSIAMNTRIAVKAIAVAWLMTLATGCASPNTMALTKDITELDTSTESIALLALDTENALVPEYHPDVNGVRIRPIEEDGPGRSSWYAAGAAERSDSGSYLLSFQLPPGQYEVTNVRGVSTALLIRGNFNFPIGLRFELSGNEIAYLGHVKMVNRERGEGEERAGSIFPLIDQGVTGFAKGTFDVTLTDQFAMDKATFESAYPILAGRTVNSRIGTREAVFREEGEAETAIP